MVQSFGVVGILVHFPLPDKGRWIFGKYILSRMAHSQIHQFEPTTSSRLEFAGLQDSEWRNVNLRVAYLPNCCTHKFHEEGNAFSRMTRNPIRSSGRRGLRLEGGDLNIE